MQMRPEVQLASVIKALTDVVLPAVDPDNKLAQEQGRLAVGLLALLSQQLPMQHSFDCNELQRLIDYSGQLQNAADGGDNTQKAAADLKSATDAATLALEGANTSPQALRDAVALMRAATGELITQTFKDGDRSSRTRLSRLTLDMSAEQLIRDRSMLLMQGWEPDPAAVPPLKDLL